MLDALDDDILSVVIDELRAHPQPFRNGLFSFSAACRKLRVLCEPVLFRRCRFIYVGTDETLPQDWAFYDAAFHISPHIQFLRMSIRASPLSEIFETLQALFARLHRLQTVFLPICEPRFSLDFVKVLLSAPNLENIVIQDIIWDDPPPYDPLSVPLLSPLKRYCESQEDDSVTIRKHPRYTAGPDIYTPAFRTELLWQAHSTIERIQIPIHPYHIQLFTSTSWDAMHELILYGLYPETAPPFIAIIQMMPNLRSLELLSWSKLVTVCPPEMAQTAELPPLQHLLIGNVSPADPFFTLLPPNIVSLGIRDVPRAYLPILLAGIPPPLSQVYQLFRSRGFPHLEHLEVVFKAPAEGYDLEEQLYASILQACPCVHSLEIHRYHSDSRNASLAVIVSALSSFKSLRKLRLNCDWPDLPGYIESQYRGSLHLLALKSKMEEIVKALPQLDTIAVMNHRIHSSWFEMRVQKEGEGSPKLVGWEFPPDYCYNAIPIADPDA